jgi:glucose/mannose-6-phosphate isomerase
MGLETETFGSAVLAGMGGSAIAGDLLKSLFIADIEIPFVVQRHYRMPKFVNKKTLVICSSYSGNTEETLSAFDDALVCGARVVAISTGGKLAAKAVANKLPLIIIPEGFPPRAALGYSFAPLASVISRLGLCENEDEEIKSAAAIMRERLAYYAPDNAENPALALARKLKGRIPIIYAAQDSFDAIAYRFKGQICENAKMLAFSNQFPESNHNELVGWGGTKGSEDGFVAILIRDIDDHKRVAKRFDIVQQYLKDMNIEVVELTAEAGTKITRAFIMIQLIDFCSYYLALLNGVDPYPVAVIDFLKERMSR